jgi:hypothetical protein
MSQRAVALISPRPARSIARLVKHVRTPLYRNAYALILSQVTSAGLGMVYWVLVARLFSPRVVGQNMGVLSTVPVLAAVSELSLTAAIPFVPRRGAQSAVGPRRNAVVLPVRLASPGRCGTIMRWLRPPAGDARARARGDGRDGQPGAQRGAVAAGAPVQPGPAARPRANRYAAGGGPRGGGDAGCGGRAPRAARRDVPARRRDSGIAHSGDHSADHGCARRSPCAS